MSYGITMRKRLHVLLGDVVSSRKISDREKFQRKLSETCKKINSMYAEDIYSDFKILKGIDEIGAVLSTMASIYEIITIILDQLYPESVRFVLALDYVDTALETMDVARMDGSAFHRASGMMARLKKTKLMFDLSVDDEVIDAAVAGQINSILLLKSDWSARQHQVVREYEKTKNQYEVANNLGITQQAVSKTLNRLKWKQIRDIEKKLERLLHGYAKTRTGGNVSGD